MFPSTGLVLHIKDLDSDLKLWNSPILNINIGHSILAIIVVYVVVLVTLCYRPIECSYHSICSVILILSLVILVCGLCDNYLNTLNVFTYSVVLFCAIGITGYIIEPVPHHHFCLGVLSQNIYDYPPFCLSMIKEPSVYVLLLIFGSMLIVSKIGAPDKNLDLAMFSGSPCYNTSKNIIHGSPTILLPIQNSSFASLVLGSLHLVSPVIIHFARIYEHVRSSSLTWRNDIVLNKIVKYFPFLCATLSLFIMGSWMPSVFAQDYAYKNGYFSYLLLDSIPSIFGPWAPLTTPLFLLCAIIFPRITPLLGKHKGLGSLLYAILWCVPALVMVSGFNLEALILRTIALLLGNFSVPYTNRDQDKLINSLYGS